MSTKGMWNDGPPMIDFMGSENAPRIARQHLCYGGGGGGSAPQVPDYSAYISHMSSIGNELRGYGSDLFKWAQEQGVKVSGIADTVSQRAGELADYGAGQYKEMMQKWKDTYGGLYDAQAADAKRMIGELPNTENQYAGKYSADVAQAFDASKNAQDRNLRAYGLKQPGGGSTGLDSLVANQRRLGQVAASEQGRLAARTEARGVAGQAIQSGLALPQIGQQGFANTMAAGNQQVGAPESAIATTAGAYQPAVSMYGTALPYLKTWGDTMSNSYNQQLAAAKMNESSGGSGIGGMLGGLAGTVAGSFLGPIGGSVGGAIGSKLGTMVGAKGGMIRRPGFAEGGNVTDVEDMNAGGGDQVVDPSMSKSGGAITDDVPARLNVGEFVLPTRFVDWRGEAWIQKEIMKADKEREQQTVAEPEMAPAGAIDMQAPQFQSGAPA